MHRLSGWGRNPFVTAPGVFPGDLPEAAALAPSRLPRGLGRSYGDASLPAPGGAFLDTRHLDRFLSFDPATGILGAEAGVTLRSILETFVPRGWFLPVTPGTQWVTLGGAVASNVHGKNHHRVGSLEHFITSLQVATPMGTFRCGPDDRPDLFRATVGGYGLTGLITTVSLRLKRVPSPVIRARAVRARDLAELFAAFGAHDADHEYSVAWVDTLAGGKRLGRGVLHVGDHAPAGTAPATRATISATRKRRHTFVQVPFPAPQGLLQPWALGLFNAAYYRLPRPGRIHETGYEGFFYPLDVIGHWNRLYGARGFFQYQCVIPDPAGEAGVEACLRLLARHGLGSFLAVLKRCGDDTVLLPFCRRGFTLALDIPHRGEETLRRLADLDRVVIGHGGRVYLTKDARLPRDAFRAMYPGWREWMEVVRRYNPTGAGRSLLSERLGLWEEKI